MPFYKPSNLCTSKKAAHLSSSKFNDAEFEVEWRKFEINLSKKYIWIIIISRIVMCLYFDKIGSDIDDSKLVKNTDKSMFYVGVLI